MIRRLSLLLTLIWGSLTAFAFQFATVSPFATGKWVKIEIKKGGIYRIPYSQLREMGFADPSRVGVYGIGGKQSPINFVAYGQDVYSDTFGQIASLREGENLLFYAEGCERVSFNSTAGTFVRDWKNIYTDSGFYFLSDAATPLDAINGATASSAAEKVQSGLGYIYHENDIWHNHEQGGQVFWGESLLGGSVKSASASLPTPGTAKLNAALYVNPSGELDIRLGVQGGLTESRKQTISGSSIINPQNISASFEVKSGTPLDFEIADNGSDCEWAHLDYAVLTYPKSLPETVSQIAPTGEVYGLVTKGGTQYQLPLPQGLRAFDISDPARIKVCQRADSDSGVVIVEGDDSGTVLLIVDDKNCLSVAQSDCREVSPTDYHGIASRGEFADCEFVIIAAPKYKGYAQHIANLHREYDGISTVVVTPEELYNEFTAGVPDPMAYRAFAKLLYQNGGKLKNMLLFGPISGNFRFSPNGESPYERIIAYQERMLRYDREPNPAIDFYGMMDDKIEDALIYRQKVSVGVGVLAIESDTEGERMVRKIEEYLSNPDKVSWGNEYLFVGGVGDTHTHEKQSDRFADHVNTGSGRKSLASTLAVDVYGEKKARQLFMERLERGSLFTTYTGHGGLYLLGKNTEFFSAADICALRNRVMGFSVFSGCEFSMTDKRKRGLGEMVVLDTPRGMVGSIYSTRTTWSNQNADQTMRLIDRLAVSPTFTKAPTIGELYASVKTEAPYPNYNAYMLCGDPALRLPFVCRTLEVEKVDTKLAPGLKFTVKGSVMSAAGGVDATYNGKVCVKLLYPRRSVVSTDYVTNTCATEKDTLTVKYDAERVVAFTGDVKNGRFEVPVTVPVDMHVVSEDMELSLSISTFSPANYEMGTAELPVKFTSAVGDENGVDQTLLDRDAPSISGVYLKERGLVEIEVSDAGCMPSCREAVSVWIGGRSFAVSPFDKGGESATVHRCYVDVSTLSVGTHTVRIIARDLGGNVAEKEMQIVVDGGRALLHIKLDAKVVTETLPYQVEGDEIAGVQLIVENERHEEVIRIDSVSPSGSITLVDKDGVQLPDGLYRIAAVAVIADGRRLYSGWSHFAVMQ